MAGECMYTLLPLPVSVTVNTVTSAMHVRCIEARVMYKSANSCMACGTHAKGSAYYTHILEKPEGLGNISKLGFNKADFWIQVFDIPITCMNRRTAKWLAKQIGEVVEIPSESRELNLGKSDVVTMVSLKYKRLPKFCYACGIIGHGIKECLDEEARKVALEGLPTEFGSWLKAPILEKLQYRSNSQTKGSSSDKGRSIEGSRETDEDGSLGRRSSALAPQKYDSASLTTVAKGPRPVGCQLALCLPNSEPISSPSNSLENREQSDPNPTQTEDQSKKIEQTIEVDSIVIPKHQEAPHTLSTLTKKTGKKWKRVARKGQQHQITAKISSPLHIMLNMCKSNRRTSKGDASSPSSAGGTTPARKGKSP
ncbi:hypothetical protein EZV62_007589 [Acer yangbiense]|uniref:CCHC-type domain-containing protein n=1 Tax=Acer yangbiense TaxID=1000413 RepID=A0A5C7IAU5_9ROSI|nr:hypothetical protein EZV62_007589 [Acer yangbiense]